jgi:hypothetical protein
LGTLGEGFLANPLVDGHVFQKIKNAKTCPSASTHQHEFLTETQREKGDGVNKKIARENQNLFC